jgi:multidrug transporter EmrE-like cation transporter
MIALSQLETAYMIALKRTSILFSVVLGYFFFKESYFGLRLVAAGLMLTGVCLIMFFK